MSESFLQYLWQHRLFEGPLITTDGQPVLVDRPGILNRDAGPDFFDARLTIGGIRWAGNVEVHVRASDWNAHHHSGDKNYDNVILHVVYVNDVAIDLPKEKKIATIEVVNNVPEQMWNNYDQLVNPPANIEIPCAPRLKEIPEFLFNVSQESLTVERLQRKSNDVEKLLDSLRGDWEQTCYVMTARYFGGKINSFAFEILAKRTPMNVLSKMKDNAFRIESLLFGQSGLLEGDYNDDYPLSLQREYGYQAVAYHLQAMPGHLWKFFRVRPAGFPTLRISQFANLIYKTNNLFSRLMDASDIDELRGLFDISASPYWCSHYNFDQPVVSGGQSSKERGLGHSTIDTIIINACVPLLFCYGAKHGDQRLKDRALTLLQQLPSERNRITRLWTSEGRVPKNAAESQALIQRHNEYCVPRRCLDCQLGFRLVKNNSSEM